MLGGSLGQEGCLGARLGGPGEIKALLDDGGEPGPGEEQQEQRTNEWFTRRLIMLEETMVRRGRDGQSRDGRGSGGQERGGRGGWGYEENGAKGW